MTKSAILILSKSAKFERNRNKTIGIVSGNDADRKLFVLMYRNFFSRLSLSESSQQRLIRPINKAFLSIKSNY